MQKLYTEIIALYGLIWYNAVIGNLHLWGDDMAIQIELWEAVSAGFEMVSYGTAIKAAEMLDTTMIDSFEKSGDLFRKLKSRCEAQGYTVEQVKWPYSVKPYMEAMINLKINKHKALCKHFSAECRKARAAFDEFISCDDENAVDDAYKKWSEGYELVINAAKILAYEVGEEDYHEVRVVGEEAKKFLDDTGSRIDEIKRRLEEKRQKRLLAIKQIQPVEGHNLDEQQINCILEEAHNHLVIAGAGTGKTTTIVGYVKYLIKMKICQPNEILMLSFTSKSAEEMKNRIKAETGIDMDIFTFHKLGMQIISGVEGKKCTIYSAPIQNYASLDIKKHLEDENYRKMFISYCMFMPTKTADEFEFESKKEYDEYIQNTSPITIKGEPVKSYCELEIANFLYSNGIRYTYEKNYEYDLADKGHSGYKPDFYLDDYGIYIEFFAVNKEGRVPDWFTADAGKTPSETYIDGIKWKRETHRNYNTTLVEVSYADKQCGRLLENLKDKLQKLGVKLYPKTDAELWECIQRENNALISGVTELIGTIIALVKSNGETIGQLMEKSIFLKFAPILKLTEPIFNDYTEMLRSTGQIDFNDMINRAADYVADGLCTHDYKYVIVDEYQDMSEARYHLLHEMRKKSDFDLFCVGDDWQSIYRFTGSDISCILNFEKYWGKTVVSKIETTYRFGKQLIDISGRYIMKNPAQIQKTLKSSTIETDFPLGFIEAYTDKLLIKFMAERVRELEKGATVFFIGRYTSDKRMFNDSVFEQQANDAIVLPERPDLKMVFITAHKSKGLQADYVFILNNSGNIKGFPSRIQDDPIVHLLLNNSDVYPFAEERRLYYVAMTRARKKVWLLIPQNNVGLFAWEFKADYGETVKRYERQKKADENKPRICPRCGGKLVYHNGSYGGFYGCENYRKKGCSYTLNISRNRSPKVGN